MISASSAAGLPDPGTNEPVPPDAAVPASAPQMPVPATTPLPFAAPDSAYQPPAYVPPPAQTPSPPVPTPPRTPAMAPPQPGYGGFSGYGGYGAQPGRYYPVTPKANGVAIASLILAIIGLPLVLCFGVGGLLGAIGAIMGHVGLHQTRDRGQSGAGLALAGIIVGWLTVLFAASLVALAMVGGSGS